MVAAEEVLDVARWLTGRSGEASARAAASRAYFAAFVHVRTLAEGEAKLTTTAQDHARLERWLRTRHPGAAEWFAALRVLRNRADYDTDERLAAGIGAVTVAASETILRLRGA